MSDNPPLADLRKDYQQGTLDEQETASEPLLQFQTWLADALQRGIPEPNAMTLATGGGQGRPSPRPGGCGPGRGVPFPVPGLSAGHSRPGRFP